MLAMIKRGAEKDGMTPSSGRLLSSLANRQRTTTTTSGYRIESDRFFYSKGNWRGIPFDLLNQFGSDA